MPNNRAQFLTAELSKYLHVHKTTIYRMLREGKLPGFRVGSDWRFSVDTIQQWQRDQSVVRETIPQSRLTLSVIGSCATA
jgi:excisionase family DNA binding protein